MKKITCKWKILNFFYLMWIKGETSLSKQKVCEEFKSSIKKDKTSTTIDKLKARGFLQELKSDIYSPNFGEYLIKNYFDTNLGSVSVINADGKSFNYSAYRLYSLAKIIRNPSENNNELISEWKTLGETIANTWINSIKTQASIKNKNQFTYTDFLIFFLILIIQKPCWPSFSRDNFRKLCGEFLTDRQIKRALVSTSPLLLRGFVMRKGKDQCQLHLDEKFENAILRQISKIDQVENELLENYIKAKNPKVHANPQCGEKRTISSIPTPDSLEKEEVVSTTSPCKKSRISAQQYLPIFFNEQSSLVSPTHNFDALYNQYNFLPDERNQRTEKEINSVANMDFNADIFSTECSEETTEKPKPR